MKKRSLIEAGIVMVFTVALLGTSIIKENIQQEQKRFEEIEEYCTLLEQTNDDLNTACNTLIGELDTYKELMVEQTMEYNANLAAVYGQLLEYYQPNTDTAIVYTNEEIILLAKVMQTEAGAKNYTSQAAIAQVILNRVASSKFPNNIHDVIYENNGAIQFAVAYDGSLDKCELEPEVIINAMRVLSEGTIYPDNLLYFCADPINFDSCAKAYAEIEGTKFYTK